MQFYCQNTIRPKKDTKLCLCVEKWRKSQGQIQDIKIRGAHLKKLRRAERGANIFGGISCEKSRFYAKKSSPGSAHGSV